MFFKFFLYLQKIEKKRKNGFTILEIIITIAILTLIATMAIPGIRSYQSMLEMRNLARSLSSDLRLTQQLSVAEQINHSVRFISNKEYRIIKLSAVEEVIENKNFSDIANIDFSSINEFSNNQVEFNPYGSVKESGDLIILNDMGETITIDIRPSGYIKIIE